MNIIELIKKIVPKTATAGVIVIVDTIISQRKPIFSI